MGTTQVHLRSPYIIAWWSAAFPGLGHLLLSKYLRGFVLFVWEVIINIRSNINLAIFYTFIGEFELAKEVIDIRWVLLYFPTYIFAIWDSYRTTVDINHISLLAERENTRIKPFKISSMEINYLDKRSPWLAMVWSVLMPGTGQLYIHRILTAFFILTWWIIIIYISNTLPAIHYSMLGQFAEAKEVLNPQWLLNLPSIYGFAFYDAYVNTVENNKLFDWEQAEFFKKEYQNKDFPLPLKINNNQNNQGDNMYVVSTFDHSKYPELAISALEMNGVTKDNILSIPLDKRTESRQLFDTIHRSDGISLFDLAAVLGTIAMLMGAIYGFVLEWGPVIWAVIGLFSGAILGILIKLSLTKQWSKKYKKNILSKKRSPEIVLMISCRAEQTEMVKKTLWENNAIAVSKLNLDNDK